MGDIEERRTGRIQLLLVDDEVSYVDVVAKRLARRNIDVTPAFSGAEAIRLMRGRSYDAAVLDLKMEDMDGLEVLKVIKIMAPRMPVIMLTGHGSQTAAIEGMRLGAFDCLTKPCDIRNLVARISAACRTGADQP